MWPRSEGITQRPRRSLFSRARYRLDVAERPLLHRIHNPKNYECGCDPDCWCRRTAIGRLVKWWFPARWFGICHKDNAFDDMSRDDIRAWKREQEHKGLSEPQPPPPDGI